MLSGRSLAIVAVLLTVAVLALAGCAAKLLPEAPWEKDARLVLDRADGLFAKKQLDQATKAVEAFFIQYPKSRSMDRALFLMGEIRLTLRDYSRALSYYKDIIEKFPSSPLIIEARYRLGQCYFELKEYDLAVANLSDRSRISDPDKLKRTAEMLAAAYVVKKNHPQAVKELAYLAGASQNEKQKAAYRDRVRELLDKVLTEEELRGAAFGAGYPADIALLRLTSLMLDQRKYREAIKFAKEFLEKFPAHPEKTRAEMLSSQAASMLSAPRYLIGALLPRSGQAAFFGDRVLKGIQLAVHTYNQQDPDNRVELLVKDTEGAPEKAAVAFMELAGKGVVAAVGPLLSKEVEAIAPALAKAQIPLFTPTASGVGLMDLSPWIFRNTLTNSGQAAAAAQYAVRQKLRKFVVIAPDDAYGKDLARLFTKDLAKNAEILAQIFYPSDTNDFGPYIRRIMEIDLRSRRILIPEDDQERKKLFAEYAPSFDALYLPGTAEKVGLLIPQLAFYNIAGKAMIGSYNWHSNDLIERAGRHAEGAVFVDGFFPESIDPVIKTVVDAYRSAYQEEPDIYVAQAYDAAMMILSLIRERKDTPTAIKDGLMARKDYPGISGTASFSGNGEAQKKPFLIKVEDGQFGPVVE